MTTNKSKRGFIWSKAEPMKEMRLAEYRQAPYDAKLRYSDYSKKSMQREIEHNHIEPKAKGSLDYIIGAQEPRWQSMSEKSGARMKRGRHSMLD